VKRSIIFAGLGSIAAVPAWLDWLGVTLMLDIVMIALGSGFFAASVLYVLACERM
jgi:uncharacterized protein involved in cysteine biosynthesis